MAKQITEEMKQKAWEYGRKSKDHYNVLTDEQKKAFWEYGQNNKLYDANKLDDYKRGEYNKYLSKQKSISPLEKASVFINSAMDSKTLGLAKKSESLGGKIGTKIGEALGGNADNQAIKDFYQRKDYATENSPIARTAGKVAGYMVSGSKFSEAGRAVPILNKIANPIARRIVGNAIGDGGMEIAEGLIRKESPKEIAIRTGLGVLFGNVGDFGFEALGKKLSKVSKAQIDEIIETISKQENVTREEVEAQINKLLLPAAKEAEPRMVGKNEVIYASGGKPIPKEPLALPEGTEPFKRTSYKGPDNPILDDIMKEYEGRLENGRWLIDRNVPESRGYIMNVIDEFEPKIKQAQQATPEQIAEYIKTNRQSDFKTVFGEPKLRFKTQAEVPRRIDDILPKDIKKPDSLYTAKQRIRVPQIRQGTGTVDDPFRWEVPNGQAQNEVASTVETIRANIDQPNKIDLQQEDTPIDTISKVLTENPKRAKVSLSDRAERVYQEVFSTKVPFEKMGGVARTQGSNLNRVQGTIEYNVVGKQVNMQGEEIGKSVVDIFSDVPKETKKGLFDYILNSHNIDRFREGKPVFGETVTSEMSASKIAEYDKMNPTFKSKQQEITKYFKNLMDEWAVKSGLVSKETASMLNDRYANYVPTYRAKDLPKSMMDFNSNVSQMIKKAKGSEDYILPIDQQMIAMTERTIKNARKNELMNTIANAFEQGDTSASRYIRGIKDLPTENIDDLLDVGKYFDEVPTIKGNEYLVNFYTNGKPRQMVVNKTLYKALDDTMSDNVMNAVAGIVKKYATQPFKNLITKYNPIFAASNIMRDIPTALTYSSNPIKMSANVPNAVEQMLRNGDNFKLFKALGGTREGLIGAGKEFKVPNLNETSKAFKAAQKLNPIKTIGDINNFTETLPRFAEFLAVLEETNDPALAIYRSAELTTDFARNGKLIKYLDNFVPYLNPSVQGFNKFFRGLKESPLKTIVKGATVITIPTIILDQINKDNSDYNNLPPRERNLYFNIPIPNSNEFIRIPKSRELGVVFSSVYEWAARASRGQEVTGKEIAQAIGENFTPADVTAPIWTPAQKAWRQIANPEAYETNYWGGLIVPESQRQYSPGQQYDANSSGIAKAIGQQFNISPFVVDYLIKSYGGVVGQIVQPIGAGTTTNTFEALTIEPWKKKFVNDAVFKSNSVNKFYDELAKAKKEAQDYNKINNVDSKVVTSLERDANSLNKIATEISKLRKEQKELEVIKGNEDKVKALQAEINRMAQRALENRNKK